jgi:hypothetical protein
MHSVLAGLHALPWFLPVILLTGLTATVLSGPVGRLIGSPAWVVFVAIGSLGLIAAITLTPTPAAITAPTVSTCLVERLRPPYLYQLIYPNETSLNVALFVPLGVACALVHRWGQLIVATFLAFWVPFGVEAVQYEFPELHRVCSTSDIMANLTGLGLGFVGALILFRPIVMAGDRQLTWRS